MIDLELLRNQPQAIAQALAHKRFACDLQGFLDLDKARRHALTQAEQKRAEQRKASDALALAQLDKASAAFTESVAALKALSAQVKQLEAQAQDLETRWQAAWLSLPNIPHPSVPVGQTAQDNLTTLTWGEPTAISPHAVAHWDIPGFEQAIDFARGVKVTGAGFPFYIGDMARLVRALVGFFLDEARTAGYTEMLPPLWVNEASGIATGQLPDKEGQMYHDATDGLYAIPTAELPVTNYFRDEIVEKSQLPLKRCAYTPCFRREAGSWGKDVRGLNRLHQFDKVELVQWTTPEDSFSALEGLCQDAQALLQKLQLPYRVLAICTGDMGFPHAKQYDLEVWAGGQKRWLEVSSCSNFTDFQARRANIRFRPSPGEKPIFVHTLNGSGLAVPRVLSALLENNLQADGSVALPPVLAQRLGQSHLRF
jgi:seryl-tRNA synthetase